MEPFEVEIRPVAEHEIEILEKKLPRFTPEGHRDRFEDQVSGDATYLIAWAEDEPVGYVQILWRPIPALENRFPNTTTIRELHVKPALRSMQVGSKIMDAAERHIAAAGKTGIAIGVEPDNARAADFYRMRGYFETGIAPWESRRLLLDPEEMWHQADNCALLRKDLKQGRRLLAVARAKINLCLRVGPRRPDGYHEIASILQSITYADEVTVEPATHASVSTRWAAGYGGLLPQGKNIAETAVNLLEDQGLLREHLAVQIAKRIPLGAGLGGGSADAAAVLAVGARFSKSEAGREQLIRLARQAGADVAFCLQGGTARATGIGDKLEPLQCPKTLWWVIGVPFESLSTAAVYRRFDEMAASAPPEPAQDQQHNETSDRQLIEALQAGDLPAIAAGLHNDLEPAAFSIRRELRRLKWAMTGSGAIAAVMTGSGSAIAGLCSSEGEALETAKNARRAFPRVEIAAGPRPGAQVIDR